MADSSSLGPAVRSVCVYCGSSNTTKPEYLDLATRFGEALAARGLRLVYGGGAVGLMGRVAKATHEAGGDVLGIMPRFLERREITYEDVPHRMVDTMHERKHIMFEESDAFVVLPGGIVAPPRSAREADHLLVRRWLLGALLHTNAAHDRDQSHAGVVPRQRGECFVNRRMLRCAWRQSAGLNFELIAL
jgi:uncharacterized protein (TIGR00725 family)